MGEIAGELATFMVVQIAVDLLFQDFTHQVFSEFCWSINEGGLFLTNLVADIGDSLTEGI